MVDPIETNVPQPAHSPAISPSVSPVMSPVPSSPTWFDHINSLTTLIRGSLIWVDIVVMTLAPFSRMEISVALSMVTGAALIFNMFVCASQHWQRSHKLPSEVVLIHPILIICIDSVLFAGYVVIWVFEMIEAGSWRWNYGGQWPRVFWAYSMCGALVAWHYHLFFAVTALYNLILQRKKSSGRIVLR